MSSLTAMQIFPQSARSDAAPCSPRHTSVRAVHRESLYSTNAQLIAQMSEEHRLESHLFDNTRFAGCDLADDRNKDRSTLARDRGHLHRHIEVFQRHVAVAFAKRPFRLEPLAVDQALDHDLGVSRDIKVNRCCLDNANRTAREPSRHRHLILVDGKFLWSGKQNHGGAPDDNRTRHRFFSFLIFSPMQVAASATWPR